jgi:hypothetical protein
MQKQRFYYMSGTAAEDLAVSKTAQQPPNHLKGETFLAYKRVYALRSQATQNI